MPDTYVFDQHYKALSDEELLKLAAEGGFTAEAAQVLGKELARRNLTFDEAKRHFAPEWLDKADPPNGPMKKCVAIYAARPP